MEMGNERSAFEVRSFNTLFGKRRIVDGTGYHYARLCRKIAASGPAVQGMYDRRSGNPKLLRGIAAGAGLFGGISLGIAFAYQGFLGVLITFALSIFGLFSAWMIQSAGFCLHLKNKQPIYIAAALCAVWIVLGLLAGELAQIQIEAKLGTVTVVDHVAVQPDDPNHPQHTGDHQKDQCADADITQPAAGTVR
jgi:hypothetical protein